MAFGDNLPLGEERTLTTLLFTDLTGYTALGQRDEGRALALLSRHQELVRAVLPRFQGREIKSMGDGFLVEFPSALGATHCAIELQRVMLEEQRSAAPSETSRSEGARLPAGS